MNSCCSGVDNCGIKDMKCHSKVSAEQLANIKSYKARHGLELSTSAAEDITTEEPIATESVINTVEATTNILYNSTANTI